MGAIVVMGVSGAGKSSVGRGLATATGADFVEGDDLHPPENRARLADGVPLGDDDRRPWLGAIADTIAHHHRVGRDLVVSCSALKRAYRDRLREAGPVRFVFLDADPDELRRRVTERTHAFMPAALLADQLAILEHPEGERDVILIEPAKDVDATVAHILTALEEHTGDDHPD